MKILKVDLKNILVSFSGGETSGYLLWWILKNFSNTHNIKIVFANTGEESEATLIFIKRCQEYFKCEVVWLEYERLSFKIVNFETAYRSHDPIEIENLWQNHPFRKYIEFFGIPNVQNMTCTRELKEYIITRYLSSIGWKPAHYIKAIGIRADEIDRIGKFWYPLVKLGITKPMINTFWESMPFRLECKGFEGNCKVCWKKSVRKLVTIARYNPHWFAFIRQMELEFSEFVKKSHQSRLKPPIRFFRENLTVDDIFELAKDKTILDAVDDKLDTNYQISAFHNGTELDASSGCSESCDAFSGDEQTEEEETPDDFFIEFGFDGVSDFADLTTILLQKGVEVFEKWKIYDGTKIGLLKLIETEK
jgi:hypothetical protein